MVRRSTNSLRGRLKMAGTSRMSFTMNILLIASLMIFVDFSIIFSWSLASLVGHRCLEQKMKKRPTRKATDKTRRETPKKTQNPVLALFTKTSWSCVERVVEE